MEGWSPLAKGGIFGNKTIQALAAKKGVTEAQVAIRWSLEKGVITIPKSTKLQRVEENLDVFSFKLDPEEILLLDDLHSDMRITWDPTTVP